ncbi:hypothetical protein CLOM_g23816 [Closterium sp. NIES-68]|nr:hypothetical protein CLOM_g23816 [Closterium sp. NIES-68]GJP57519.1 hypothetical protein CLOP_g12228 [Closterium sp. NIES-67]
MAGEAVDAVQELKLAAMLDARDEQLRWEEEDDEDAEEAEDEEEGEEEAMLHRVDDGAVASMNDHSRDLSLDAGKANPIQAAAHGGIPSISDLAQIVGLSSTSTSSGLSAGVGSRWVCGPRVEAVMRSKVARLVKPDMLLALQELQRQQQWRLAARVFEHVRTEHWYKPDPDLCARMINCLGLAGRITDAQALFQSTLEKDGVPPCSPTFTALLAAHCRSGDYRSGREVLGRMREAGAGPYDLAYMILIKTCEAQGDEVAARELKRERDVVLAKWGELGLPKPPRRSKKK